MEKNQINKPIKFLFHRATEWNGPISSSTQILAKKLMEKGHCISYMNSLNHPLKQLFKRKTIQKRPLTENLNGVNIYNPYSVIPFSRHSIFFNTLFANFSYRSCRPSIKKMVKNGNGSPDIVWTVPPGSSVLKKIFPHALLFMQVVDYYPAFLGNRVKKIENVDYALADHIFTIGQSISDYLTSELDVPDSKVTTLGQGVTNKLYSNYLAEPADIRNFKRPRYIYVGALKKCDTGLLKKVHDYINEKGGELIFIGPEGEELKNLFKEDSNVHFLGPKMPELIPAYLMHSDFGLMLYDQKNPAIYFGQNPLKLYEYAAAGLPTVSTNHNEFKFLNHPLKLILNSKDIFTALSEMDAEKSKIKQKMIDFAQKNDWDNQVKKVLEVIHEKGDFQQT